MISRAQLLKSNRTIVIMQGECDHIRDFVIDTISTCKLMQNKTDVVDWANGWSDRFSNGEVELLFNLHPE